MSWPLPSVLKKNKKHTANKTGTAWHLSSSPNVMVTVLEAEDRAGGHAHTVDVSLDDGKTVPVDTG